MTKFLTNVYYFDEALCTHYECCLIQVLHIKQTQIGSNNSSVNDTASQ